MHGETPSDLPTLWIPLSIEVARSGFPKEGETRDLSGVLPRPSMPTFKAEPCWLGLTTGLAPHGGEKFPGLMCPLSRLFFPSPCHCLLPFSPHIQTPCYRSGKGCSLPFSPSGPYHFDLPSYCCYSQSKAFDYSEKHCSGNTLPLGRYCHCYLCPAQPDLLCVWPHFDFSY